MESERLLGSAARLLLSSVSENHYTYVNTGLFNLHTHRPYIPRGIAPTTRIPPAQDVHSPKVQCPVLML